MTKILKFLQVGLMVLGLSLMLIPLFNANISVHAQSRDGVPANCTNVKKEIKWVMLFDIGNFLPLIPAECGIANDGNIQPLPIKFLFDIIIRTAGFLFSLAFYLLPVAIIVYGARVLFLPFDPKLNYNEFLEVTTAGRTITRELGQFLTGIIIILLSYTIVFTILGTLQINSSTDLSKFFTL